MALEFKHIHINADGKEIVNDVSLSIAPGELHLLMGQNGSGKSSFINGVMGHPKYTLTEGEIMLDGEDITHAKTEVKARKGIFLSMQHLPEVAGVTLANFLYRSYKAHTGDETSIIEFRGVLEDIARTVGISAAFLDRDLNVGLSGGEKKLSEVLQLAVLKPKYAILDEIDSGVDVDSLHKVFALIDHMRKEGAGVLLVSHHPALPEKITPDVVHIMRDGRVARSGGAELASQISQHGFSSIS